jgi:hypothetical protein
MATTNLSDVFLGSEQSKYAGIALFITILIICLAILFTSSKIAIEQRIVFVIFILIITVPSILMSLFELTCIVTGGNYNTRWWCWLLAWVLAVIIIFYCIMIIVSLFISMTTYDMANERISEDIANNKVDTTSDNTNANNYAKNIMKTYEEDAGNPLYDNNPRPPQRPVPPTAPSMPQDLAQHHAKQPTLAQQYNPPVPPSEQSMMPQQSQHLNNSPLRQQTGNYTGFDSSDNLSPLDAGFNTVKEPVRQRANLHSDPRMNDTVEPYAVEEMFSTV